MARLVALLLVCASCVSHLDLLDAGQPADGGGADDGGLACDAGLPLVACATPFAACTAFLDLTQADAGVSFGGALGLQYSPPCIRVKVGQAITFSGDFATHPIAQACGPGTLIPQTPPGTAATFTPCGVGQYGYYCRQHGAPDGTGMAGEIDVVP